MTHLPDSPSPADDARTPNPAGAGGPDRQGAGRAGGDSTTTQSVIIRQHSNILYWWPVWVVGFLCAILSHLYGEQVELGGQQVLFHPSRNLGVIFVAVFALIFVRTNIVLRGVVSLLVILAGVIVVLLLTLLGGWRSLLALEQQLVVHMDAGFYFVMSSVVFVSWVLSLFVLDRFLYCEFRPGQLVVHETLGGGLRTFDTRGISVYKLRDDPFRHWGLGFGSGDLHIATTGAEGIRLDMRNVTLIDQKLAKIQSLVAMSPDEPTAA